MPFVKPFRKRRRSTNKAESLGAQIIGDRIARTKKKRKVGDEGTADDALDVTADGYVPADQSEKIFKYARELQDDEEKDAGDAEEDEDPADAGEGDDDDEEDVELEYSDTMSMKSQFTDLCSMPDIDGELDPEDERILNDMMPTSFVQTRNLADMILEKIREKEEKKAKQDREDARSEAGSETGSRSGPKFDPKVTKVYKAVGTMLSKYRSGRIPKALKLLPHMQDWEELLLLTRPHNWTPHAMYQATRIFASNLNERMAQRFYQAVLLPSVRSWMKETKHMPPHYFMAIRKAIFKQKAFIRGFLLPLVEEQDCGLREAMVVGSVLQKTSIKVVNAAVAMAKMALMPYSGATSLFLRVFFDKRYQLPLGCIDAIVQHFGSQLQHNPSSTYQLPVLWHQCLLTFLQRYKNELTPDQIYLINKVINKHNHYLISSEIRRELMPIMQRLAKDKDKAAKTGKSKGKGN
jgi:essential nuclear protein 1|uniref:Bystin n=1 Tax=Eutreptiella gymnastica TaxID=73025 RepID=A0A7S4FIF0_9EUGL|mmetsp:Transcript_13064/g.23850  ORF Transcript_13064/g.23850 Transcript_13064/m.23850 type:complete len:464 (+) Transcript_13064:95-1486(+)|eukprot:CAMPEP_0174303042 /NCGR_PEP_ID=MMETSP0809-20121228/59952_1 /TAXON_ID=73025 ORGANISM="Eutreptiella gymnastica-like, Strain CCMP1594" /NCGR_SAMPLE_ID=MMETSP0809 /ASSEMBLY_ACC=CAM_ASM_000658 /LENGTH=463 /DNA_ID=CAMNT_0015409003 /DNA_START=85 /DNA_END=1476 /DNA_ORIENTATION=+